MMNSILVALDETPSSRTAEAFAIALAARTQSALTGVAVLDRPSIEGGEAVPPGGMAYKLERDARRLADAKARGHALADRFTSDCTQKKVESAILSIEGEPLPLLITAAATRDLVILGHDCAFHGRAEPGIAAVAEELLRLGPRPLILTPDSMTAGSGTIIAYDASLPAMRALQMFVLLGLGGDGPVHVVSVDDDKALAEDRGAQALAYLAAHDIKATPVAVASSASPSEIVLSEVAGLKPRLLMMGAFGHRGLKERLFGSTTSKLIAQAPVPLFVFH